MRIEWLHKNDKTQVILFFTGWGMNTHSVDHLQPDCDVLVFSDYRTLEIENLPDLMTYQEIQVIAWSMGVWAAAQVVPALNVSPVICIAFNGTETPVHDQYGIPAKIYQLTEKGMNERGREKFIKRMFTDPRDAERFFTAQSLREMPEVCEELYLIRKQAIKANTCIPWTQAYISQNDVIFPTENQMNWWINRTAVKSLPGGHYPFYHFFSWKQLLSTDYDQ